MNGIEDAASLNSVEDVYDLSPDKTFPFYNPDYVCFAIKGSSAYKEVEI